MPTIPSRWPRRWKGIGTADCMVCGARYPRHRLIRGRDGILRCYGPGTLNDAKGCTALELDEQNAARAPRRAAPNYLGDTGSVSHGNDWDGVSERDLEEVL